LQPELAALRLKMETEGIPRLGAHVLMGDRFLQLQANAMRALEDGRITTIECVAKKPG